MEPGICKSDVRLIQQNIDTSLENRRLKARVAELEKENEALKNTIRGSVRGHMAYYEKRRKASDLISDIWMAGRVAAGMLALTAIAWNVFMIIWGLRP